jgi:hypothetical protein
MLWLVICSLCITYCWVFIQKVLLLGVTCSNSKDWECGLVSENNEIHGLRPNLHTWGSTRSVTPSGALWLQGFKACVGPMLHLNLVISLLGSQLHSLQTFLLVTCIETPAVGMCTSQLD